MPDISHHTFWLQKEQKIVFCAPDLQVCMEAELNALLMAQKPEDQVARELASFCALSPEHKGGKAAPTLAQSSCLHPSFLDPTGSNIQWRITHSLLLDSVPGTAGIYSSSGTSRGRQKSLLVNPQFGINPL